MPRSSDRMLDLTELASAPQKVRLPATPWPRGLRWLRRLLRRPASRLYDMANPEQFGALQLQRLMSIMHRAEEIPTEDPGEHELAEMLDLLVDACQIIVPGAPREVLAALGVNRHRRLVEAFRDASPALTSAAARRAEATTTTRATSGS